MHPVKRNLLHHQRQIDEMATSLLGPVSVAPGEGLLEFVDGSGQVLFTVDPSAGASILHEGQLATISTHLGNEKSARVQGDSNLQGNINTVQSNVDAERSARVQGDANVKAYATGQVVALGNRLNTKASKSSLATAVSNINDSLAGITGRLRALESKVGDAVTPGSGGVPVPGTDPDPTEWGTAPPVWS